MVTYHRQLSLPLVEFSITLDFPPYIHKPFSSINPIIIYELRIKTMTTFSLHSHSLSSIIPPIPSFSNTIFFPSFKDNSKKFVFPKRNLLQSRLIVYSSSKDAPFGDNTPRLSFPLSLFIYLFFWLLGMSELIEIWIFLILVWAKSTFFFLWSVTFALLRAQRRFRILFRCSCRKFKTT